MGPGQSGARAEHRPGATANVGVNAMPRTAPQHTSCCGAVDELGAAAPPHHSHNCVLSSRTGEAVAVVACVRRRAEEEDRFPEFSDRAQPAPAAGCSGPVTSRVQ